MARDKPPNNNMGDLAWSADNVTTKLAFPVFVLDGVTSPAIENLRGGMPKGYRILYIGPTGYTSPLGAIFSLHTYVTVKLPANDSLPNIMEEGHD